MTDLEFTKEIIKFQQHIIYMHDRLAKFDRALELIVSRQEAYKKVLTNHLDTLNKHNEEITMLMLLLRDKGIMTRNDQINYTIKVRHYISQTKAETKYQEEQKNKKGE